MTTAAEVKCEWPDADCKEPVVAKIGLPSDKAIWVCLEHFNRRVELERGGME